MPGRDQIVHYADVDGRSVAWAAVGDGPALLVGGWWSSHLGLDWRNNRFRRFVDRLASGFTVIRYDRPGTGLSDRSGPAPQSREEETVLLTGLADAVGLDRFAVFGASSGSVVAAALAATLPGRVSRLVLYGGYAHGADIASPAAREAMVDVVRRHWGLGSRALADVFMPNGDAADRAEFARFQRLTATPDEAAAALELAYRADSRDLLPAVTGVPTLVLHRAGDRAIPAALGADLADRIPGATYVQLSGEDHLPWLGDVGAVTDATVAFLQGREPRTEPTGDTAATRALSAREVEVLRLVAAGSTDTEIAEQLVLSTHTVHRHVSNIRAKLGVPTRAAAAAWAARRGRL